MKRADEESAFAAIGVSAAGDVYHQTGISQRDYFAAHALASVIGLIGIPEDGPDDLWDASIAERSYALADAMLAERAKP